LRSFRIVVAAHGPLAEALVASAAMICGRLDDVVALGLDPQDSPESFAERLRAALGPPEAPVLILADLQGGTPCNVACLVARDRASTAVVTGVNLGLLIESVIGLETLDEAAVDHLVSAGRDSIVDSTRRLVRDVT